MTATTERPQGTVTVGDVPDLRCYDVILVNSSAGKDSQASLDVVAAAACLEQSFARACQMGDPCWEGIAGRGLAQVGRAFAADGITKGQRVWKRQPEGGFFGLGTSPCSRIRLGFASMDGIGIAESSAWVYGWA